MNLTEDKFQRHQIPILDGHMSYLDEGEGDPIIFLHGNPTSSYLWRNVIPYVQGLGRSLAPDLMVWEIPQRLTDQPTDLLIMQNILMLGLRS